MLHYPEQNARRKHDIRILVALFIFLYCSLLALASCGGATGNSATVSSGMVADPVGVGNTAAINDPAGANDPSSINNAVAAAAQTNGTVTISSAQTLSADLIIPSNVDVVIEKGGSIVKASNYTLKINGPFSAGLYQVFSGFSPGDVTFGSGSVMQILPQWWGAKGDGVHDDTKAIQCAINSIQVGTVYFAMSSYKITAPIMGKTGVNLKGAGMEYGGNTGTVLKPAGPITALDLSSASNLTLEDMSIDGGAITAGSVGVLIGGTGNNFTGEIEFSRISFSSLDIGIKLQSAWYIDFSNCYFEFNNTGVYGNLTSGGYATTVSFYKTRIAQNTNYGVYYPGGGNGIRQLSFDNCDFELNGETEIYLKNVSPLNITSSWFEHKNAPIAVQIMATGPGNITGNYFGGEYSDGITDNNGGNASYLNIANNSFSGLTNAVRFSGSCSNITLIGNDFGGAKVILQGPNSSIQP